MTTKTQLGTGKIVTAHFSDGREIRTQNCSSCHCECHDNPPRSPGIYIEVKLDDPNARVGMARVNVERIDDK